MAELVPDLEQRAALVAEMPRLPFSYFEACVPMPADWAVLACGYLLLSEQYRQSASEARNRGCPWWSFPATTSVS